eukprot:406717-Amphidinium_carterae.1
MTNADNEPSDNESKCDIYREEATWQGSGPRPERTSKQALIAHNKVATPAQASEKRPEKNPESQPT